MPVNGQLRLWDRTGQEVDIALVKAGNSWLVAVSDLGGPTGQLGYEQVPIDDLVKLTPPADATQATIVAEGEAYRYTLDGTTPTATFGMPVDTGSIIVFNGSELSDLQVIGQQPGSILNILWEG